MFRLVLYLPYNVVLVHRQVFETECAAEEQSKQLPHGFEISPEEKVDLEDAVVVPVK